MEALRTAIESNRSTVALAEESIDHFSKSRKNNNIALLVSVSLSVITLIILAVQTISTSKIELEKPLELNKIQLEQVITAHKENAQFLRKKIDSIKSELHTLRNTLNLRINNSSENEKGYRKPNK